MFCGLEGREVTGLRFSPRYYGGPFLSVDHPDSDLPRRDPHAPVPAEVQARVELSGDLNGERIIAPFRDGNESEAILGQLHLAEGYPTEWSEEERAQFPTIQGLLAEVVDRLEEKASRATGARRSWLGEALASAQSAAAAYAKGEYELGADSVRACADYIRGAGRRRKRSTPILLGPGTDAKSEA